MPDEPAYQSPRPQTASPATPDAPPPATPDAPPPATPDAPPPATPDAPPPATPDAPPSPAGNKRSALKTMWMPLAMTVLGLALIFVAIKLYPRTLESPAPSVSALTITT